MKWVTIDSESGLGVGSFYPYSVLLCHCPSLYSYCIPHRSPTLPSAFIRQILRFVSFSFSFLSMKVDPGDAEYRPNASERWIRPALCVCIGLY